MSREKEGMRPDYALYTVAVIFFIITGMVFVYQMQPVELWVVATAVLGFFFMGLGYTQRPKTRAAETTAITPTMPKEEVKLPPEKPSVVVQDLTEIKGIGAKRAEQLRALGVATVEDLAKASAKDLASKLKVSPKITKKWIEEARKILEKS